MLKIENHVKHVSNFVFAGGSPVPIESLETVLCHGEEYPLGAKFARFHHAQRFEGAEPVERKVPGRSLFFFCIVFPEINSYWVVVSIFFCFHRHLGKIPILTNVFQRS